MTENFALSHGCRPGQVRVGYVGTCQLGVEARIDANGELLVRSPGQMLGYYKLPELAGKVDARAELTESFERLLEQVNATLEDHEQLDYLVVVKQPWTIESGLLTPTLKIRCDAIESRYLPNVEAWHALRQKVIWES